MSSSNPRSGRSSAFAPRASADRSDRPVVTRREALQKALAGRGPSGVPGWDDDRTVVVVTMGGGQLAHRMDAPVLAMAEESL